MTTFEAYLKQLRDRWISKLITFLVTAFILWLILPATPSLIAMLIGFLVGDFLYEYKKGKL